jgi:NADH-quinone oxidoreductase subunit I
MKILKDFSKALSGLWSLVVGLKITGVEFYKPGLTVHYPRREVTNLDTFRGHIDLVAQDNNPITPKCIMCGKCMEICPSGCIQIGMHIKGDEGLSAQGKGRTIMIGPGIEIPSSGKKLPPSEIIERELDRFHLSYNYCSLCGLCVQCCPVGSLKFSRDSYLAGASRQDFEFDLLQRLKEGPAASGIRH